jgi:4-hydroxy-2-oxoheptanedioate aldolase
VKDNPFKAALARGERQVGLWLSMAQPYSAEVCASAGFQWLLIDGEHAPNDVRSILAQLQAVAAYPSHPIVRAVNGDPALIKQLLDIGAQTLLVPMVDSAAQAAALVAATRYPPQGSRGVGAAVARASRWGARRDYLAGANDETCLLVQVETAIGLRNLKRSAQSTAFMASSSGRPISPLRWAIAAIPDTPTCNRRSTTRSEPSSRAARRPAR